MRRQGLKYWLIYFTSSFVLPTCADRFTEGIYRKWATIKKPSKFFLISNAFDSWIGLTFFSNASRGEKAVNCEARISDRPLLGHAFTLYTHAHLQSTELPASDPLRRPARTYPADPFRIWKQSDWNFRNGQVVSWNFAAWHLISLLQKLSFPSFRVWRVKGYESQFSTLNLVNSEPRRCQWNSESARCGSFVIAPNAALGPGDLQLIRQMFKMNQESQKAGIRNPQLWSKQFEWELFL